ncbi:hypothetical protein Leryth_024777 [Lithospermum erythrorhizon]|nr:hypothetical protein Leryth_024777 [Lithospermum erythrorhizon]
MEVLLPCSAKPPANSNVPHTKRFNRLFFTLSTSSLPTTTKATTSTFTSLTHANSNTINSLNRYWMVHMDAPPIAFNSKPQIIDYYVNTLQTVFCCESDAQMCIYDASCDSNFGFCCEIDDQAAQELARIRGVLSVRPDNCYSSPDKDYHYSEAELSSSPVDSLLFPDGTTKHWLVPTDLPPAGALSKVQAVDYFTQILTQVLGNEKDAQMCIYDVSWASNYGFCCELDEKCAKELADVPGVVGVRPDENFVSDDKDYQGLLFFISLNNVFFKLN